MPETIVWLLISLAAMLLIPVAFYFIIRMAYKRTLGNVQSISSKVERIDIDRFALLQSIFCGPVTYWRVFYRDSTNKMHSALCRTSRSECTIEEDERLRATIDIDNNAPSLLSQLTRFATLKL
ncbi:MAG: hypothetical protein ACYTGQ_01250 [Planctomycetota bacterium]|jgi:hypothetical protein